MLAELLVKRGFSDALVLAIPQGGLTVGYEIAQALHAPLDTHVVKKVVASADPEFVIAAVAPSNVVVIDEVAQESFDTSDRELTESIEHELKELQHGLNRSQAKTIIIVDDGLTSLVVAEAAIQSAKIRYEPDLIVYATPVCARDTVAEVAKLVDDFICLSDHDEVITLDLWYDEVEPIS
jgi:putative phosphoribosyl transferase